LDRGARTGRQDVVSVEVNARIGEPGASRLSISVAPRSLARQRSRERRFVLAVNKKCHLKSLGRPLRGEFGSARLELDAPYGGESVSEHSFRVDGAQHLERRFDLATCGWLPDAERNQRF